MRTDGGSGEQTDRATSPVSGISRRSFLAGGLLTVGGSSLLWRDGTKSQFSDSLSASGTIRIDDDPTLNYQITDETNNNKAEYRIAYQVEWVENLDRIEVQVENLDDSDGDTFMRAAKEGTIDYPRGGGSVGGAGGNTYEFTFRVFETDNSTPIIEKQVTDEAGDGGAEDGDMGNVNDTKLQSITIIDTTENNKGNFVVEYELEDVQNDFEEVVVAFDNQQKDSADRTRTTNSQPRGSVSYSRGGVSGHTYDITVKVRNSNSITVDSHTITVEADQDDSSWTA